MPRSTYIRTVFWGLLRSASPPQPSPRIPNHPKTYPSICGLVKVGEKIAAGVVETGAMLDAPWPTLFTTRDNLGVNDVIIGMEEELLCMQCDARIPG